jgi:hypothetical protein
VTALLTAPAPAGPAPAARRRRVGPALLLAAVAAGVGLLWSALLLWAPGSAALAAGAVTASGGTAVVDVPGYQPGGTTVVDYRHGAEVALTVPLSNDGPLPVEVTAVTPEGGPLPLLDVRAVDGLPLTLAPGASGEVVLRGVLGNCRYYHEREAQNLRTLAVEARVGIGPLQAAVALPVPLARPVMVRSPMIVGCPDRTIDRQADDRTDALTDPL